MNGFSGQDDIDLDADEEDEDKEEDWQPGTTQSTLKLVVQEVYAGEGLIT